MRSCRRRRGTSVRSKSSCSAAPIAEDLAYRLMQLGYASKAVTDSHIQAVSAAMTGPEVTTVTVSHSGSTIETILAA